MKLHVNFSQFNETIAKCASGDAASWRGLVLSLEALVYSLAGLYAGARAADDVFYHVIVELYLRLETLRDGRGLPAWLVEVTKRKAMQAGRYHPAAFLPTEAEAAPKAKAMLQRHGIESALRSLPGSNRRLLEALYHSSLRGNWQEAAARLNMSLAQLKTARAGCISALADLLGDEQGRDRQLESIHLDYEQLLDFLDGEASAETAEEIRTHLTECAPCAAATGKLSAIIAVLSQAPLIHAPPAVLETAFAIFEAYAQRRPPRIIQSTASLVFDSWTAPALAGFRGTPPVRQLAMAADEFDLHLSVNESDAGTVIRGQLLARCEVGFIDQFDVVLMGDDAIVLDAAIANEFGEFQFHTTEAATRLSIQFKEGTMIRKIFCSLPKENRS